ncbi:MAG: hypothetical protein H6510_00445 [Acidobacteria bacterium]|nr:hypothetical protein [Acidobacteriota bacterium]MCB9396257.1 hypothetical protein [Acidobacteriota bacterium]
MNTDLWEKQLQKVQAGLCSENLIYFPIRHHSPACSWHLTRLIQDTKPATILIEGPVSLTPWIRDLAHPQTQPPVALYTQFTDKRQRLAKASDSEKRLVPLRLGAYYPLCAYSPEWVAIREGSNMGAKLAFIDLDYEYQVLYELPDHSQTINLLDERYLAQSQYLQTLAKRRGCRDTNELWDRLFESQSTEVPTPAFIQSVATYCFFARLNTPSPSLKADGTFAREQHMVDCIQKERKRLKKRGEGPLLVVTGGFHTPALVLPDLIEAVETHSADFQEDEIFRSILPYSFPQLDALNGYAAGVPSPAYYQQVWDSTESGIPDYPKVARSFLAQLHAKSKKLPTTLTLSTADAIGAMSQAQLLSQFRGNPGPMREDLLDGIRSSFIKGSLDCEGQIILDLTYRLLCGDRIGQLAPGTQVHPLINAFRTYAAAFRLDLSSTSVHELHLSIYAKKRHKALSKWLHLLRFLKVPFARFTAGPDFLAGTDLDLQIEHWSYQWSPQTETALLELSYRGTNLEMVARSLLDELRHQIEESEEQKPLRAVQFLLLALRFGFDDLVEASESQISEWILTSSSFNACCDAALLLDQNQRFNNPLQAGSPACLERLALEGFAHACRLLDQLGEGSSDRQAEATESLRSLYQLAQSEAYLDQNDLFWSGLNGLVHQPIIEARLRGCAAGLLFLCGRITQDDMVAFLLSEEQSADQKGRTLSRFLIGLFTSCREFTWQETELMQTIHRIVQGWDDDTFLAVLPELRLAFSQHTPRETDRVARLISGLIGVPSLGSTYQNQFEEGFVTQCFQVARLAEAAWTADHLGDS